MKRLSGYPSRNAAFVLLVLTTVLYCQQTGSAKVKDADRTILKVLAAAQRQHEKAFPRGSMKATVEIESRQYVGKLHAIWDGDRYFVEADSAQPELQRDGTATSKTRNEHVVLVFRPGELGIYSSAARYAGHNFRNPRVEERYEVRPLFVWYVTARGGTGTWSELLDRQLAEDTPFQISVMELEDGRVHVTSTDVATGGSFVTVYSMKHGGNVVEYYSIPSSKRRTRERGRYQWQAVDADRWALKEYVEETTSVHDEQYLDAKTYRLLVEEFDPNPVIPPDRFQFSSLQIPPKIKVEVIGPKKEEHGSALPPKPAAGTAIPEEKFLELADILRTSQFGRPRPK